MRTQNMLGISGIRFYRNPGPGKLYVLEGPDRVGKTTLGVTLADDLGLKYLRYDCGAPDDTKALLHRILNDNEVFKHPALLQEVFNIVRYYNKEHILQEVTAGHNLLVDRSWISMLVYGQAAGLELDYLLSTARHFLVPDVVMLISRSQPLPGREEKQNAYDTTIDFQQEVTRLYYWLLEWWKQYVPIIPIGMVELGNCDKETAAKRSSRRLKQLIERGR